MTIRRVHMQPSVGHIHGAPICKDFKKVKWGVHPNKFVVRRSHQTLTGQWQSIPSWWSGRNVLRSAKEGTWRSIDTWWPSRWNMSRDVREGTWRPLGTYRPLVPNDPLICDDRQGEACCAVLGKVPDDCWVLDGPLVPDNPLIHDNH